jgi:Protein of unknown function (DUF2569)
MNTESIVLKDSLTKLSDEQLLVMVTSNSVYYSKEALDYASEELARREVPLPSQNGAKVLTSQVQLKYKGVGGWLLLLCLNLTIFSPLLTLSNLVGNIKTANLYSTQFPSLFNFVVINTILAVGLMCFCIYAGVALWTVKNGAVKIAKTYLLVSLAVSVVEFLLLFTVKLPSKSYSILIGQGIRQIIRSVVYFAVWYAYLNKSERVKATYGDDMSVPEAKELSTLNLNK